MESALLHALFIIIIAVAAIFLIREIPIPDKWQDFAFVKGVAIAIVVIFALIRLFRLW